MMKRRQLAVVLTLAATLATTSLFADQRHDQRTDRGGWRHSGRQPVTLEGRIRDIDRERNGFVIRLDRGDVRVFAPKDTDVRLVSRRGERAVRNLERGDVIRVRGTVSSRNLVHARSIDLLHDRDARQASLAGIVESVDRDRGLLWLREDRTRRTVAVQMDRFERRHDARYSYGFGDVRRGDRITVRGEWSNGRFNAFDVDRQVRAW